jgi:hypothetical protein
MNDTAASNTIAHDNAGACSICVQAVACTSSLLSVSCSPFLSLSSFLSRAQTLTHSHSSLAIRCAILLDELDDYRGLRKGRAMGHIVVETRTHNAVPLLRFSCSRRVIALPTGLLNMHRVRHVCACL